MKKIVTSSERRKKIADRQRAATSIRHARVADLIRQGWTQDATAQDVGMSQRGIGVIAGRLGLGPPALTLSRSGHRITIDLEPAADAEAVEQRVRTALLRSRMEVRP